MVSTATIPLLNAQQMGMAPLVHGTLIMPELAQASAQTMTARLVQQEAQQVNKPAESSSSALVNEKEGGSSGSGAMPGKRQARDSRDDDTDSVPPSPKPLVGKLLNVKV